MREWSFEAIGVVDKLKNIDQPLKAKIMSYEEFDRANGRFEYIYGIDLFFDEADSVCDYLVDEQLAIRVRE